MLRTLGAFVVAPFPVALFQSTMVALWPKEGMGVFENPPSMFVALCIYFYLFALLLGVPAWLIFRRGKQLGLGTFVTLGLLVALLPSGTALLLTAMKGGATAYMVAYNVALFGIGGAVAGALFWFIAVREKRGTALQDTFA